MFIKLKAVMRYYMLYATNSCYVSRGSYYFGEKELQIKVQDNYEIEKLFLYYKL